LILGHNREDFWENPESIIGKFSSIIDIGLVGKTFAVENLRPGSTMLCVVSGWCQLFKKNFQW